MVDLKSLTGNEAAAIGLRQARPDVCAVYPITPQTELMQKFAEFVANGVVDTEMLLAESEHSAMSAAIGSSAAGARTVTATSANGLALMWEVLHIAASDRLPIVMPEVNRALSGPINIHCDHADTMGCRDTGWIQIYAEDAQEAYDNTVQAFRIAEHPKVLLPVMIPYDGFIISHTDQPVSVLDDETVTDFVGEYEPKRSLLDVANPYTLGPLALQDYYFEHKRQQVEAMRNALQVIGEVGLEYGKASGRTYGHLTEYRMDDADVALIALGSTCGTISVAVDEVREQGIRAGLMKLRVYRPFPTEYIVKSLSKSRIVGVLDRSVSFGIEGGPLYHEISSALSTSQTEVVPFVYGLGGRDITVDEIAHIYRALSETEVSEVREVEFVGLRECKGSEEGLQ